MNRPGFFRTTRRRVSTPSSDRNARRKQFVAADPHIGSIEPQYAGTLHSRAVAVLAQLRTNVTVGLDPLLVGLDDPLVLDAGAGIDSSLGQAVLGYRRYRNLHDQKRARLSVS